MKFDSMLFSPFLLLVFAEEENQRTRRKTLEARERLNKQFYLHMTPSPAIEPEPQ
jgi:hypothetical protein